MTRCPATVGVDQSVAEAQKLMAEHEVRSLPVVDGRVLVGVVSQGDAQLVGKLQERAPEAVRVAEAMSSPPFLVGVDAPLEVVVSSMYLRKIGSAVVTSDAQIVGVFTSSDALRALADLLHSGSRRRRANRAAPQEPHRHA